MNTAVNAPAARPRVGGRGPSARKGTTMHKHLRSTLGLAAVAIALSAQSARAADALPSWQDGAAKTSIVAFVAKVTTPGSPEFVPSAERTAVFDNDGTLWAEQPLYFQVLFALDRVKVLAPQPRAFPQTR
jgi:hypothetical protein